MSKSLRMFVENIKTKSMIYITSIIVAFALLGCYLLQKRSDHYLSEAVRIHEKYNELIEHMSTKDSIIIEDREGVEHKFKKQ